jgi:peptidoglycan-associated lipoprotein
MRPAVLVVLPFVLFCCAHKPDAKKDTPPTTAAAPKPDASRAAAEGSCNSDSECRDGQLCIRNRCVDISAGLAECNEVRVHFALNSSEIESSDRGGLERSARCLKGDHALHVTIEGNADERGTEEYNLALGDRRATAVAKYLESLGASGTQLKTVSYGKEKPLCTEHDEDCWSKNRRAEVSAVAGARGKKKTRSR